MSASPPYTAGINPQAVVRNKSSRQSQPRTRYRACLICSYVQTSPDWLAYGCPNCEELLNSVGSQERVKQCTSLQFDGVIAMLRPDQSWVAKWQRLGPMRPGLYAARVIGRPPRDVLRKLKEKGVPYVPRDDVAGENAQNQEDDDSGDDEDDYEDDGMVVEDDAEEGEEDLDEDTGRGGGARASGGRKSTIRFQVSDDSDSDEE
ncbi:transcription elongation factor spt4 [Naganishia albida]|nr:transcription elongation factor spt4 [Naganishia albida]